MSRNNNDRLGQGPDHADPPIQEMTNKFDPLNFVAPTEFVELPSRGLGYSENHPLHKQETIEIKYMTAKDEDILTSQTLLKKGLAIERFLDNVILDKRIKAADLFVGDRNAIIIAARVSGYGAEYETKVTCPACAEKSSLVFDLKNTTVTETSLDSDLDISMVEGGNFQTTVPFSKFKIVFRLLKGTDENYLAKLTSNKRKGKLNESLVSDQFKRMIVSIEGHSDREIVNRFVDNMPTLDSRHLRACYKMVNPNVRVIENYACPSCGFEDGMEVPFGADFFWPDR